MVFEIAKRSVGGTGKAIRTWAIAGYYGDVRDVSSIILIAEITGASMAPTTGGSWSTLPTAATEFSATRGSTSTLPPPPPLVLSPILLRHFHQISVNKYRWENVEIHFAYESEYVVSCVTYSDILSTIMLVKLERTEVQLFTKIFGYIICLVWNFDILSAKESRLSWLYWSCLEHIWKYSRNHRNCKYKFRN